VKCECGRRKCGFSLSIANHYIFLMKLPTGFTYRNLHGFTWFSGDSMALVLLSCAVGVECLSRSMYVLKMML